MIKRLVSALSAMALTAALCVSAVFASVTVQLTGTSTLRAGDTLTLTLRLTAEEAYGIQGEFSYNSSQVELVSVSSSVSGWEAKNEGDTFLVYDNNYSNPVKKATNVFTAKFKVSSSIKAGTKVTISAQKVEVDGESGTYSAQYSATIAEPLSDDATLKSLSVEEGTLTPAFSSSVTEYSLSDVPFSVSELSVTAKASDDGAKVSISGNSLAVGANTVTITVKAEDGTQKKYTIKVTREQDPNYVASSDATMSDIKLSAGTLSPVFAPDILDYIVYVPFETESISISGTASDDKAAGVTGVEDAELAEGENVFSVVCRAEDGTEQTYAVTVMRMPLYSGAEEDGNNSEGTGTSQPGDDVQSTVSGEVTSEVEGTTSEPENNDGSNGLQIVIYVALLAGGVVLGILLCTGIAAVRKNGKASKKESGSFEKTAEKGRKKEKNKFEFKDK